MGKNDLLFAAPRGKALAALSVILLTAAVLRVGGVGRLSLWHDEVLTFQDCSVPWLKTVDAVLDHETCPPLYFLLANAWCKGCGTSDVSLRLPSALLGIAGTALLYFFAKDYSGGDEAIGLTAAGVLAFSPMHIAYSQEARPYALLFVLILLCVWAFVRALRSGGRAAQVAYVLTGAAALYTHTFAIFALAAINLEYVRRWIVARRGGSEIHLAWGRWVILQLAIPLLFWPWLGPTREVAQMGLPWMRHPTPFVEAMAAYSGRYAMMKILGLLTLVGVVLAIRRRDGRIVLPLLLSFIPVVLPIAYGIFTTRYGIAALIGVCMTGAIAARSIGRAACIVLVLLAAANWAVTCRLGEANHYPNSTPKPALRDAAAFVRSHAQAGDSVELHLSHLDSVVWHHYTRDHPLPEVDGSRWIITTVSGDTSRRQVVVRQEFPGVVVLETEPSAPGAVPSSAPVK